MTELRKERMLKGLCVQCGSVLNREGICCIRCNNRNNVSKYYRNQEVHEEGYCVNCSSKLDRVGWFCIACANNLKTKAKLRNAERRLNHLCVQCGVKTELGSYCQRCRDMRMDMYWKKKKGE